MSELDKYLISIKDLSIMPPVLLSILQMDDDNEMSFTELEKMVQSDQILVSRMLKLANTPFYSRGNEISSVKQLITRLGFKTVRSMVAMAFVNTIFSNGNYKKFRDEVWEHSIATGILSQFVCSDFGYKKEREITLFGGILKDLGKIILNTIDRNMYIQVLTEYQETGGDIQAIEKKLFQVDNIEMGAATARQWKLPKSIVHILLRHNNSIEKQSFSERIVTFSELVARKGGLGKFDDFSSARYDDYMECFGVAEEDREKFPNGYIQRLRENDLFKFCSSV